MTIHIPFEHSYVDLGRSFSASIKHTPVAAPRLVTLNDRLARHLGFDPSALRSDEGVGYLAGNDLPMGAQPIATAYAGHQFGASCRSSAMGERCFWAKLSMPTGCALTFS